MLLGLGLLGLAETSFMYHIWTMAMNSNVLKPG